MSNHRRLLIGGAKLALTVAMLAALYQACDWRTVIEACYRLNPWYLGGSLLLLIPQVVVSAARWRALTRDLVALEMGTAIRHTLVGSAFNLLLPAKMGDLSKAALVPCLPATIKAKSAGRVVMEKGLDVGALMAALGLGSVASPLWASAILGASSLLATLLVLWGRWRRVQSTAIAGNVRESRGGARASGTLAWMAELALWSGALWTLHLLQLDWFVRAAGVQVAWTTSLSRLPLALFAGIVPLAWCGVGTRDAALVWLYADVAPAATMASVGLLTALRYVIPGLFGIPLVPKNWNASETPIEAPLADTAHLRRAAGAARPCMSSGSSLQDANAAVTCAACPALGPTRTAHTATLPTTQVQDRRLSAL